jgi:hypothetical protein
LARGLNTQEVACTPDPSRSASPRPAWGLDRHAEGACDQRRGRGGVDGPADHPARAGIQHHRAVQLAFTGDVQ